MNKKYFVLEISDESAAEAPSKYDWYGKQGMSRYRDEAQLTGQFPDFTPLLKQAIYDDKQFNKRNDFIHSIAYGIIMSERAKNIFEKYTLPTHKFFPIKLYQQKKWGSLELNLPIYKIYYNLFFDNWYVSDYLDFINFQETRFWGTTPDKQSVTFKLENADHLRQFFRYFKGNKKQVDFFSADDTEKLVAVPFEQVRGIETDNIILGKNFDWSLDLFSIPQLSWMIYISEQLKSELEKAGMTGMEISEPGKRQYLVKRPNPSLVWENNFSQQNLNHT